MTDEPAHHSLGASAAHRWMNCPGSVREIAKLPKGDDSTEHSREGTLAHEHAAALLLGQMFELELADHWSVDDYEAIQSYVDYCNAQPGQRHVEVRLAFEPYIPGGFGTADFVCFHDNTLTIVDLKFGKGEQVYAEQNPQLMLYALGALMEFGFLYDIKTLRLVIHQPRRDHVDEWEISVTELRAWADSKLKIAVLDATNPNAPLVPGPKQCRWCNYKAECPALAQKTQSLATQGFDFDDAEASQTLSQRLEWVDTVRTWASAVEARAMEELIAGKPIEGWKLVDGRSTRGWNPELEPKVASMLEFTLGENAYVKKILSPAQAEKAIGKKSSTWQQIESEYVKWSEPKPSLARASSSKQAITVNATEGFDS